MPRYVLDARTATPHFPGIGRYVTNLARALIPQLAPDERLTVFFDPAHPLELPSGEAVHSLPVDVSPFSLRQQGVIPRLLHRHEADVYHSAYYLMPYRTGTSTLLTLYDLIPIHFPEHSTLKARLLFRWATMLALRGAQHTLAISEATRRDFLARFPLRPEQITAIPLAADPAFSPQPPDTIAALRAHHKLPEKFLLYLGSNKPHKNLVRLIEAWAAIQAETPDVTLVIAGAWLPQHPEPRQRAQALGIDDRVCWLGPLPGADLPALYTAAEAFIFPSLYEGFGLPVIECHGLRNVCGLREHVLVAGGGGRCSGVVRSDAGRRHRRRAAAVARRRRSARRFTSARFGAGRQVFMVADRAGNVDALPNGRSLKGTSS